MKYFLPTLLTAALLVTFTGCDQAQKALDTIDKAKSLKAEVEKKAKEVTDKARELIPGSSGESAKEKGDGDSENED